MNLVKYLACDHVDQVEGEPAQLGIDAATGMPELNPFAHALCSMKPAQLRIANFDAHLKDTSYHGGAEGNARNGAKGEACQVLVLLFTRHSDPNAGSGSGEGTAAATALLIEDLLPSQAARQSFENWMVQNVSKDVQNAVKSRATKAAILAGPSSSRNPGSPLATNDQVEVELDVFDAFKKRTGAVTESVRQAMGEAEAHAEEQLDELGIKLFTKDDLMDDATCWKDSKLAKKQFQLSSTERDVGAGAGPDLPSKDEERIKMQNAERQKMLGRDPLGIRPDTFDLQNLKGRAIEVLDDAINDLEEEMDEFEPHEKAAEIARKRKKKKDKHAYSVDQLVSLGSQKNALEAILTGGLDEKTNAEGEEKSSAAAKDLSILPTDADFNPMLFLTLVHRNASYEQLKESVLRLDSK